jgi:hypothetical protein
MRFSVTKLVFLKPPFLELKHVLPLSTMVRSRNVMSWAYTYDGQKLCLSPITFMRCSSVLDSYKARSSTSYSFHFSGVMRKARGAAGVTHLYCTGAAMDSNCLGRQSDGKIFFMFLNVFWTSSAQPARMDRCEWR